MCLSGFLDIYLDYLQNLKYDVIEWCIDVLNEV